MNVKILIGVWPLNEAEKGPGRCRDLTGGSCCSFGPVALMSALPSRDEVFLQTLRCKEGSETKGESKRLYFALFFLFLCLSMNCSCKTVSIFNREAGVTKITPIRKGKNQNCRYSYREERENSKKAQ